MKAYDEDAKYILFINKSITILDCSTVNSLMIDFLGHISQQLPLVLKPIGYKFKSHLLKVGFELLLSQRLCKWVCHIICGVDSLDLNVTFLKVIVDEMVSPFARNSSSTNSLPDVDFRSSISDMKSESVYP